MQQNGLNTVCTERHLIKYLFLSSSLYVQFCWTLRHYECVNFGIVPERERGDRLWTALLLQVLALVSSAHVKVKYHHGRIASHWQDALLVPHVLLLWGIELVADILTYIGHIVWWLVCLIPLAVTWLWVMMIDQQDHSGKVEHHPRGCIHQFPFLWKRSSYCEVCDTPKVSLKYHSCIYTCWSGPYSTRLAIVSKQHAWRCC